MARHLLRLGTRRSPLALAQAHLARTAIEGCAPHVTVELVEVTTTGDADQRDLALINQRGLFVAELERALEAGSIDLAVHSCKDLRLALPAGLELAAFLPREDPRDVVCAAACSPLRSLADLPPGARIATGSARRSSLLRTLRSDLEPVPIRGNVGTRLDRARERGDHGVMLACAGLRRLGMDPVALGWVLDTAVCVPDAGQGAVVLQSRSGEFERAGVDPAALDDATTRWAVEIERAVAELLGGGCDRPVGVHVAAATTTGCDVPASCFSAPEPGAPGTTAGTTLRRDASVAEAVAVLADAAGVRQGAVQ